MTNWKKLGNPVIVSNDLNHILEAVSRRIGDEDILSQASELFAVANTLDSFKDCSVERKLQILLRVAVDYASDHARDWLARAQASGKYKFFRSTPQPTA